MIFLRKSLPRLYMTPKKARKPNCKARVVRRKPRAVVMIPPGVPNMHSDGFFSDAGRWIKNAAIDTGRFLKKTKALSTIASIIPHPAAKAAGAVLSQAGLGSPAGASRSWSVARLAWHTIEGGQVLASYSPRASHKKMRSFLWDLS